MSRRTAAPRGGFTLIELLVVIAIISILVGLTSAAVMRVRLTAKRTVERTTIGQIYTAVGSYKAKMNVAFIPAGFTALDDYTTAAAQSDAGAVASSVYLRQVFPQIVLDKNITYPLGTGLGTAYGGGGAGNTPVILDGNQTLVLFLTGGKATQGQGFSNNRRTPFAPGVGGEQRLGPFYEKIDRINGTGHLLDGWGNPYAYFVHNPSQGLGTYQGGPYTLNGSNLTAAYRSNNPAVTIPQNPPFQFLDPKGCQIISAGPNGLFGPGGFWQPGSGAWVEGQAGGDDLASFNNGPLLAATN